MSLSTKQARNAWTDFLMAAGAVYSKLATGSMGNGKTRAWWGRQVKKRKDHPVMSYLHHARNTAEHGIEDVVA